MIPIHAMNSLLFGKKYVFFVYGIMVIHKNSK